MESIDSRIPKRHKSITFSEKYYALCNKHGGLHKSHNMRDCHPFNSDGTPIKTNGGAGNASKSRHADKHRSKESKREGANFAQIIQKEVRKAFRQQSPKCKKRCTHEYESDSKSDESSQRCGSDSTGESIKCEKLKLTSYTINHTTPGLNKAIVKPRFKLNRSNYFSVTQRKMLRKSCIKANADLSEAQSEIHRCHTCDIGRFQMSVAGKSFQNPPMSHM